ncbi:NAD(P)/FAD-dependent oxidoreductase [Marinobacterium arenosum]|uniref:NAD(P)/FAD-dependent oxidoreductase n=1 Tax=Marinobacterium arenosum TaxID=2862496 RepID=UPI001C966A4C|nr:NAD(P)/FAD-dependent oxidoreductase [Marinobacterium arenosum]MBY4677148.1 NAD(P)/FAD-dependent oxidoreductase [Marinobacterium arenosum]
MNSSEVAVIGAGPCGLFQVFELGLQGIRAELFDALPAPGGQCIRLYPDKPIYDIPACPEISARQLVDNLCKQIEPFAPVWRLGHKVTQLEPVAGGGIRLTTDRGLVHEFRAVVIAGGSGAFEPIRLLVPGVDRYVGHTLHYAVDDIARYRDKRVVVVGGGDSALDWALNLIPVAREVVLVHRSQRFRAQPHSVASMQQACDELQMLQLTGRIAGLDGEEGQLKAVRVQSSDGVTRRVEADQLLVQFGLAPQVAQLRNWRLELHHNQLVVDTEKFQTSQPGVYAVGDINWYPGKQKLILSGFHEAALAAFAIKQQLQPDKPVRLQYTTTSPLMHQRLGVEAPELSDLS